MRLAVHEKLIASRRAKDMAVLEVTLSTPETQNLNPESLNRDPKFQAPNPKPQPPNS
jgi:hypothetical protein